GRAEPAATGTRCSSSPRSCPRGDKKFVALDLRFEFVAPSRVEVADLDRLTAREDPGDQASSRSWPASGPSRPRSAVRRPEPASGHGLEPQQISATGFN